jgi:hypothetical protein
MTKEVSKSSPFYWLNMCEGIAEQITDLLDEEVHRPGDAPDAFRKDIPQQDPELANALQQVHSKLQEALDTLTAALSTRQP